MGQRLEHSGSNQSMCLFSHQCSSLPFLSPPLSTLSEEQWRKYPRVRINKQKSTCGGPGEGEGKQKTICGVRPNISVKCTLMSGETRRALSGPTSSPPHLLPQVRPPAKPPSLFREPGAGVISLSALGIAQAITSSL